MSYISSEVVIVVDVERSAQLLLSIPESGLEKVDFRLLPLDNAVLNLGVDFPPLFQAINHEVQVSDDGLELRHFLLEVGNADLRGNFVRLETEFVSHLYDILFHDVFYML